MQESVKNVKCLCVNRKRLSVQELLGPMFFSGQVLVKKLYFIVSQEGLEMQVQEFVHLGVI